jgi:hypothetical protein
MGGPPGCECFHPTPGRAIGPPRATRRHCCRATASGFIAILTGAIAERFLARDIQREAEEVERELDAASVQVVRRLDLLRGQLDELEAIVRARSH